MRKIRNVYKLFLKKKLKGRDLMEDISIDRIKMGLKKTDERGWTGFIRLRTGTSDRLL
jgi:DNA-binding Xre family transcriptional regulator